jgi:hypothetical protein
MRLWFRELITYSQALTIVDVYVPFTDIGGAVLEKIAAPRGVKITAADRKELTDRFATMPPYPDVRGAAAVEGRRLPPFHPDRQHCSHLWPPADPWRPG